MGAKEIEVMVLPGGRVDAKNAAAYIGLSEKTLAMMRSKRRGPKYLKRGRIFYYIKDIEEWMGGAERVSTSQNVKDRQQAAEDSKRNKK